MKKQTGEVDLSVHHLAQIKAGTVSFGDLTFFVGAQAGGKSLLRVAKQGLKPIPKLDLRER